MRKRERDTIDTWLWTWGALAKDLRKIEDCAGRVTAAEVKADLMSLQDRKLTASAYAHSDPTYANVAALSAPMWAAVYTIHVEVGRWPRIWRDVVRDRFEGRLDWNEIERRNCLNENQRKVLFGLMKRELGMSLRLAGLGT